MNYIILYNILIASVCALRSIAEEEAVHMYVDATSRLIVQFLHDYLSATIESASKSVTQCTYKALGIYCYILHYSLNIASKKSLFVLTYHVWSLSPSLMCVSSG